MSFAASFSSTRKPWETNCLQPAQHQTAARNISSYPKEEHLTVSSCTEGGGDQNGDESNATMVLICLSACFWAHHSFASVGRTVLAKRRVSQLSLSCHNWVTSALGGRAEEAHKQSNYILVDLIVCCSGRPARGCLINSNETSAPGSFDTALPHQPSLWNEPIAGMDVVLIIYKASIR